MTYGEIFKTGIHYISSFQFCLVKSESDESEAKIILAISGYNPNFDVIFSDLFNATNLIKYYQNVVSPNVTLVDFDDIKFISFKQKMNMANKMNDRIEIILEELNKKECIKD